MTRPINERDEPITVICMEKCQRNGAVINIGEPLVIDPGEEIPLYFEVPKASAKEAKSEEGMLEVTELTKAKIAEMAKRLYMADISTNQTKDAMLEQLATIQQKVDPDGKLLKEDSLLKGWGVMGKKTRV